MICIINTHFIEHLKRILKANIKAEETDSSQHTKTGKDRTLHISDDVMMC